MTRRITVNFDEDDAEWIETAVEEGEYASKSECVQDLFQAGRDATPELQARINDLEERLAEREERIKELEQQVSRREDRIEELESQLRERSQIEEKIEDLPAKIKEHDETYSERRRRLLDQASIGQRLKWKVTGVPVEEIDED